MTSTISCPLWSSVFECQRWECAFTSTVRSECGMFVTTVCSVVRPCQQFCSARRYIHVCNCDMFSVVNVYLDHLKLCVVCINGLRYVMNVMVSLMSVMSPPHLLTCATYRHAQW